MNQIDVRGGAAGIAAECQDMLLAARMIGDTAAGTVESAAIMHAQLVAPPLVASAVISPVTAARFELALLTALDGPHGVSGLGLRAAVLGVALRGAADSYLAADQLLATAGPLAIAAWKLPPTAATAGREFLRGMPGKGLDELLTSDPSLADLVFESVSGGRQATIAGRAAVAYPDGSPHIAALGPDPAADAAGPPRGCADLIRGLIRRNRGRDGEIDVRIITGSDGAGRSVRRAIVDIPGTKDWKGIPVDPDVANLGTNLRAMAGLQTTYERGIVAALGAAGVSSTDEVMLVGHSLGGTIAVNTARDLTASGKFHVTHVVTAGAPIGGVLARLPSSVSVLAIENSGDIVPELDTRLNPDLGNITTVTVHHNHADLGANHDLAKSYLPGAEQVDSSADPSVRAYLDGARNFLDAGAITTQAFAITRTFH